MSLTTIARRIKQKPKKINLIKITWDKINNFATISPRGRIITAGVINILVGFAVPYAIAVAGFLLPYLFFMGGIAMIIFGCVSKLK